MYIQHDDVEIRIPEHISKYGVISGHIFILTTIVAYIKKYYKLAVLSGLLYISTITYWRKVKFNSIHRFIDIGLVLGTLYYITFYESEKFKDGNREIWIYAIMLMGIVYIVNSIIFYFQTIKWLHEKGEGKQKEYKYFSLDFTEPFTEARELCYKYTMMMHSIFCHIMPNVTAMYCVLV